MKKAVIKIAPGMQFDMNDRAFRGDGLRAFVGGESGSGKSSALMLLAEQMVRAGKQIVILDLHGEFQPLWEVRPGGEQSVVTIGYGVDPVDVGSVDSTIERVREGHSVCVDLMHWADVEPDKLDQFVKAFVRELVNLRRSAPKQTVLFIEEAASVIPQAERSGQADTIRLFTSVIMGGRKFGLYTVLASQRTSLVNHNVIAGCNVRLFLRSSEQKDWQKVVRHYAPEKLSVDQYRKLPSGKAIVSSRWWRSDVVQLPRATTELRGEQLVEDFK